MAEATAATAPEGATAQAPEGEAGNENHKKHLLKLARERDEAKAEAKALKDRMEATERAKLEETNQFKTLYEQEKAKAAEVEILKAKIAEIDARADKRIEELAGKLTDETLKAEYQTYIASLDRDKRQEWLTAKTAVAPEPKSSPAASRPGAPPAKDVKQLTRDERAEWAARDLQGYKRAFGLT